MCSRFQSCLAACVVIGAAVFGPAAARSQPNPPPAALDNKQPWSEALPQVKADIAAGRPLVVHVTVPLCSNQQIDCGAAFAGKPGDPDKNLYWGAVFGARRFMEMKYNGWEKVAFEKPWRAEATGGAKSEAPLYMERGVYRRRVSGKPWGQQGKVEQIVVLDAIHGDRINQGMLDFWKRATQGSRVSFEDGNTKRDESVHVAGYAGHNRMMDGLTFPAAKRSASAVPSFVLACKSESYFTKHLSVAGSEPLVMTSALMAPEGYVVNAMLRGLAENLSPRSLRARTVDAYARWQKISRGQASAIFAPR